MRITTIFTVAILLLGFNQTFAQTWQDDIGFTQLRNEIGGELENGEGVTVQVTEAPLGNGNYMPDSGNSQFSGKTIVNGSPGGNGTSGHSNSVATTFFSNIESRSISSGITDITVFDANDYLNRVLFRNQTGGDPLAQGFEIGNHSYIIGNADDAAVVDLMQRFDFLINRDNSVMVGGVNNGSGNNTPELWAPSMNSIAVGRSDGNHSRGVTNAYQPGRFKPDIVAPGFNPINGSQGTSFATPKVSGAAAILLEQGRGTNATQNEVIRALLFAGATKEEFADWDRTTTRPIDEVYGFGELNIYNSYHINGGGEFDGSTSAPSDEIGLMGWDYGDFDGSNQLFYNFTIEEGMFASELSAALTWNTDITDTNASVDVFTPVAELSDLNLALYDSTDSFLGSLVDSSESTLYNHEHIFLNFLDAGTYTFAISGDSATDFGLAWRITSIPEPTCGVLFGLAVLTIVRRRRR